MEVFKDPIASIGLLPARRAQSVDELVSPFRPPYIDPAVNRAYLRDRFGIKVTTGMWDEYDESSALFTPLNHAASMEAILLVREEVSKYSPYYISDLEISRIRLVADLQLTRSDMYVGLHRVGGATYPSGQVYVVYHEDDRLLTRKTIHHELAHLAQNKDQKCRGNLRFFRWKYNPSRDRSWDSVNSQIGFPFIGGSYWDLSEEEKAKLQFPGFASLFGMISRKEDEATIAEVLMTSPKDILVENAAHPTVFYKAILMVGKYSDRTFDRMGMRFFRHLQLGLVREGYWK